MYFLLSLIQAQRNSRYGLMALSVVVFLGFYVTSGLIERAYDVPDPNAAGSYFQNRIILRDVR
jgi:hypothetical protein